MPRPNPPDFLKYWRVVRHYALKRYKLTEADLDVLFYFYTEPAIPRAKFVYYDKFVGMHPRRSDNLLNNGWIIKFKQKVKNKNNGRVRELVFYKLSIKACHAVNSIYKILDGRPITEDRKTNPLIRKKQKFSEMKYKVHIQKMNRELRKKNIKKFEKPKGDMSLIDYRE